MGRFMVFDDGVKITSRQTVDSFHVVLDQIKPAGCLLAGHSDGVLA